MTWFKYGCCVPANTVLWLLIVLFIFSVIGLIFCFMSMAVTRWIFKRRIRNKSECLRNRYEQEDQQRKEMEFKMKELAMRPVHGHHHHQREPVESEESQKQSEPFTGNAADVAQHQKFLTNISQNAAYFGAQEFPQMKDPLFTGDTPLNSRTSGSTRLFTRKTSLESARPDQLMPSNRSSTSYLTAGTKITTGPTSITSSGVFARSSSTATRISATENLPVEPYDVAATAHAIVVGGGRDIPNPPPFPGILLLNKDKRPLGQCPSDRVILMRSKSDTTVEEVKQSPEIGKSPVPVVAKHATAHGYVLATLISDLTESDSMGNIRSARKPPSAKPSDSTKTKKTGEGDVHTPTISPESKVGRGTEPKRKSNTPKPLPKESQVESSPSSASASKSFFPYWTSKRGVFSKVEPTISPSGKIHRTKVVTSEINIWEANKTPVESILRRAPVSSESGSPSRSGTAVRKLTSPNLPAAIDVYELRRQVERIKYGEISRGMHEITKTAKGKSRRPHFSSNSPILVSQKSKENVSPKAKYSYKSSTIKEAPVTKM